MKLCECGCGLPAPIAQRSDNKVGRVRGQPCRFICGHYSKTAAHKENMAKVPVGKRRWRGPINPNWRGGRYLKNGYVVVLVDGQYVYEHRHIMEELIGRKLMGTEVVHHQNGNKEDNRPENLELLGSSSAHGKKHSVYGEQNRLAKLTWESVREIRRRRLLGESAATLAEIFRVHAETIRMIFKGKTWKEAALSNEGALLMATQEGNGNVSA